MFIKGIANIYVLATRYVCVSVVSQVLKLDNANIGIYEHLLVLIEHYKYTYITSYH